MKKYLIIMLLLLLLMYSSYLVTGAFSINEKDLQDLLNSARPVGISDRGYSDLSTNICYNYSISEAIGIVYLEEFDGGSLLNASNNYFFDPGVFSIQLNLVGKAFKESGMDILWFQNVYNLKKDDQGLSYVIDDEIHNITSPEHVFLNNSLFKSWKGKFEEYNYNGIKYVFYRYIDPKDSYKVVSAPFHGALLLLHVKIKDNKIFFAHGFMMDNLVHYEVQDEVEFNYKKIDVLVDGCNPQVYKIENKIFNKSLAAEFLIGGKDATYRFLITNKSKAYMIFLLKRKNDNMWAPPYYAWSTGIYPLETACNIASKPDTGASVKIYIGKPQPVLLWTKNTSDKYRLIEPEVYMLRYLNGTTKIILPSQDDPALSKNHFKEDSQFTIGPVKVKIFEEQNEKSSASLIGILAILIMIFAIIIVFKLKKK